MQDKEAAKGHVTILWMWIFLATCLFVLLIFVQVKVLIELLNAEGELQIHALPLPPTQAYPEYLITYQIVKPDETGPKEDGSRDND